jgi:hypothetical protein
MRTQVQNKKGMDVLSVNSLTCIPDSVYGYTWDTINNNWYLTSILYDYYDVNGLVVDSFKNWNGTTMENTGMDSYSYTGSNLTFSYQYSWNGSSWENSWKTANTYSGNNLVNSLSQMWNSGGYWDNTYMDVDTYNGANLATDTGKSWDGSAWSNDVLSNCTSYSGANLTSALLQRWDGVSWNNEELMSQTFSGNNLTHSLYQNWNGANWDNSFQVFYNYTGGVVTSEVSQNWYNNNWVNFTLDSIYYCSNNVCSNKRVEKEWGSNAWRNHYKYIYFGCNSISGIKPIHELNEGISIYPNPANGIVTIESSEELKQVVCTNSWGLICFQEEDKFLKKQVDLSSLPSGVYFIKIKTESSSSVKKIILNN